MKDIFQNYKSKYIPIFDWSFLSEEKERKEYAGVFKIDDKYKILATDGLGDIIIESDNKIYLVNHEEPGEDYLLLTDSDDEINELLLELMETPDYSTESPLKLLKEVKSNLILLKKKCPENLKYLFDTEIENVAEMISDWKFYQTPEGKRYLATESFKNDFYSKIKKPEKYKYVEAERDFETEVIKIVGFCTKKTETKEELEKILSSIECSMQVEFGKFYGFNEYQELVRIKNRHEAQAHNKA